MSKIQNPIVIIHKNAHHDSYSVAITDGSDNVNNARLWCAVDSEGDGSDADPWVRTSYYMAAEIVRLRQRLLEMAIECGGMKRKAETYAIECAAAKIAIEACRAGRLNFTMKTHNADRFMDEMRAQITAAVDGRPAAWLMTEPESGHSVATRAGHTLNFYREKDWIMTPLHAELPEVAQ